MGHGLIEYIIGSDKRNHGDDNGKKNHDSEKHNELVHHPQLFQHSDDKEHERAQHEELHEHDSHHQEAAQGRVLLASIETRGSHVSIYDALLQLFQRTYFVRDHHKETVNAVSLHERDSELKKLPVIREKYTNKVQHTVQRQQTRHSQI
jgi:hypothetical protein